MSSRVPAIYRKEMLDMLRDRRTIISMVVVPVAAIPLMFVVVGKFVRQAEKKAGEEAVAIAVRYPERLPGLMNALAGAQFKFTARDDAKAAVEKKEFAAAVEPVETPEGIVVHIYGDSSRPASGVATQRLEAALGRFKDTTIMLRLQQFNVPPSVLEPFTVKEEDVGPKQRVAGAFFGGMFGYIVVLLMFTGGMYPAIDLTAGEKERRTLEVVLSAPARRDEIILGKLMATTTAVFGTAVLSIISVFVSFRYMEFGQEGKKLAAALGDLPRDPGTLGLIFSVLTPTAVFGASLMIAVALFAKSYKEAQSYLTPLIMAVVFPLVIGMMPGMHLTPALAAIPVFNSCQLVKEIFQGEYSIATYMVAMVANTLYACAAFIAAVMVFKSEKVLFRT